MSADRWSRVNAVLADVLERPPREHDAYLREACRGDEDLRERVQRLIALEESAAGFFSAPIEPDVVELASMREDGAEVGRRIGRYEIRRTIASGGMGTVYEAEQDHPRRTVALKVLRPGMSSPQALKRFHHEAQILGHLHHPCIAQVYDAGTFEEGAEVRPYFAMELVSGRSLLEHCEMSPLGTRARLELFVQVCDAIQYAHHCAVIHRDLKPDNILVDESGEPKILDFGVARTTDSDIRATTLRTDVGQLIGTVPYMSPEQVTGDPHEIDSRADVYALGVVLYELLCGALPHDVADRTIPDAVRMIREEEPSPLSSMSRVFRGDLDTIAAKALEKEKDRRYQTAAQLAADVRHHLADEPIVARPASTFYQLQKFVRRNRALTTGVAIALVALTAGTGIATWQAVRARGEAAAALTARDEAEAVTGWLEDMLAAAAPGTLGADVKMRTILDEASRSMHDDASRPTGRRLADQPRIEARLRHTMAMAYERLGLYDHALGHAQRALELRRRELGDEHEDTLATCLAVAKIHRGRGANQEAERLVDDTLEACRRALPENHPITIETMIELGKIYFDQSRGEEAEKTLTEALRICRQTLEPVHLLTMEALDHLAGVCAFQKRRVDAERLNREALEISRTLNGDGHPRTLASVNNLALALRNQDRLVEAAELVESVLQARAEVEGAAHHGTLVSMYTLGSIYVRMGRLDEAETLILDAADGMEKVLGPENWQTLWVTGELGGVYEDQGRFDEAEEVYVQVLEAERRSEELGPGHRWTQTTFRNLARLYARSDQYAEAEALLVEALAAARPRLATDRLTTVMAIRAIALFYRDRGRLSEAEPYFQEVWEIRRDGLGAEHPRTLRSSSDLGAVETDLGRLDQGRARVVEAMEIAHTLEPEEIRPPIDDVELAQSFDAVARNAVRDPGLDHRDHELAVALAERAVSMRPDDADIACTLGASLYRATRYEDALATLFECAERRHSADDTPHPRKPDPGQPRDRAFMAMSHQGLGDREQAISALRVLRELMQEPAHADDREARRLLDEAEAVIAAGGGTGP
jgi:tetratricopeptide (TPR) repeat protein